MRVHVPHCQEPRRFLQSRSIDARIRFCCVQIEVARSHVLHHPTSQINSRSLRKRRNSPSSSEIKVGQMPKQNLLFDTTFHFPFGPPCQDTFWGEPTGGLWWAPAVATTETETETDTPRLPRPLCGQLQWVHQACSASAPLTHGTGHCPFDDRPDIASPVLIEWLNRNWPA